MNVRDLSARLACWKGPFDRFVKQLDREGLPYLSYSKISSLEFCPQRYFLEYVRRVRLHPEPRYFTKGRLLHEAAARLHRARMHGRPVSMERLTAAVRDRLPEQDAVHVHNGLTLVDQQVEDDWAVVAVEEPFVLEVAPELPPVLGVVDLVLQRGQTLAVIDHKSGRQFGQPDRLQLVLYHEYAQRRYAPTRCEAYFDQYRWVANLARVRKPASRRTKVAIRPGTWNNAVRQLKKRYAQMQRIEHRGTAPATGNCWVCPFRDQCPKADFGSGLSGW